MSAFFSVSMWSFSLTCSTSCTNLTTTYFGLWALMSSAISWCSCIIISALCNSLGISAFCSLAFVALIQIPCGTHQKMYQSPQLLHINGTYKRSHSFNINFQFLFTRSLASLLNFCSSSESSNFLLFSAALS